MSVEKCSASASNAWLSYFIAMVPSARDRHTSTPIDSSITRNAYDVGSISTL